MQTTTGLFNKGIVCLLLLVLGANAKENIAVLDFQNRGGMTDGEVQLITDRINSVLLDDGTFTVIERQQINEILKEQGFQRSGACSEQECLVQMGQLLAVGKIISGSIGRLDDRFVVTMRIVEVQRGLLVAQEVGDFRASKADLFTKNVPGMVVRLMQKVSADQNRKPPESIAGQTPAQSKTPSDGNRTPVMSRPYVWGPIAAVGIGAAVAVLVLSKKEKTAEPSGTTNPDEMPLPDLPTRTVP